MKGGTRGPRHTKAQLRCKALLESAGYIVDLEKEFPQITQLGIREWQFDIFAYKPNHEKPMGMEDALVVELDGEGKAGYGHSSHVARAKDRLRDKHYHSRYGLRTVRLPTAWVIGKLARTDEILLQDMMHMRTRYEYSRLAKELKMTQ